MLSAEGERDSTEARFVCMAAGCGSLLRSLFSNQRNDDPTDEAASISGDGTALKQQIIMPLSWYLCRLAPEDHHAYDTCYIPQRLLDPDKKISPCNDHSFAPHTLNPHKACATRTESEMGWNAVPGTLLQITISPRDLVFIHFPCVQDFSSLLGSGLALDSPSSRHSSGARRRKSG